MTQKRIGIDLRCLSNLTLRFMENKANKKYVDNITGTNGWIIGYISDHSDRDIYQRDLEEEFSITRSTASKVVNLMVRKGLIVRQSVTHDARLKKLVLTDKALDIAKLMDQDGENLEKTLRQGFSDDEIETLHRFLERLKKNLSEA
jgi:DNA-binding MarR family transcriptional regulator